jgi:hypothetical protein
MTRITIVMATGLALAVTLPAVSAQAQGVIRTFVSTTGSDSNPCSITSPCRHFSAAVAATSVGGEIDALEPGAYGSFTITQAVTIEGQGWSYVAPPTGGNGITINAASGNVTIHGVSINGVGTTNSNGIAVNPTSTATITLSGLIIEGGGTSAHGIFLGPTAGGELNIIDTTVRDFTDSGIAIQPAGAQINVFISNSYSLNNGQHGIKFLATGGGGGAEILYVIDHTTVSGNTANGFDFETVDEGNVVIGTLSQSVAGLNNNLGIYVNGDAGVQIYNCSVTQNGSYGLSVANGGLVTLSSSSFVNGNLDVTTDSNNGSKVNSFGNNAYSFFSGNIVQQSLR